MGGTVEQQQQQEEEEVDEVDGAAPARTAVPAVEAEVEMKRTTSSYENAAPVTEDEDGLFGRVQFADDEVDEEENGAADGILMSPPSRFGGGGLDSIATASTHVGAASAGEDDDDDDEEEEEERDSMDCWNSSPNRMPGQAPVASQEDGLMAEDEVDASFRPVMVQIRKQALVYYQSRQADDPTLANDKDRVLEAIFKEHRNRRLQSAAERKKRTGALTLADLTVKVDKELFPDTLRFKSGLYLWIIVLMGVFYTLPVAQLLIGNQNQSVKDGNLDVCYYNFLCKVSYGRLEDYGHIFSNVAYVISGIFFIAICCMR